MKAQIGMTTEQRSRWHRAFCWFPFHLGDGAWVWMEFVERRAIFEDWEGALFEYRKLNGEGPAEM